ncbi:unnamed protein product [Symbiodinium natans]|uniref:Uncharacterized protein n=1 Tax=Symbiodinium natans TaxID=878477 RepID=A0A812RYJ3_9DINO|nr:unnamed protein product [Symbiodinium natans]
MESGAAEDAHIDGELREAAGRLENDMLQRKIDALLRDVAGICDGAEDEASSWALMPAHGIPEPQPEQRDLGYGHEEPSPATTSMQEETLRSFPPRRTKKEPRRREEAPRPPRKKRAMDCSRIGNSLKEDLHSCELQDAIFNEVQEGIVRSEGRGPNGSVEMSMAVPHLKRARVKLLLPRNLHQLKDGRAMAQQLLSALLLLRLLHPTQARRSSSGDTSSNSERVLPAIPTVLLQHLPCEEKALMEDLAQALLQQPMSFAKLGSSFGKRFKRLRTGKKFCEWLQTIPGIQLPSTLDFRQATDLQLSFARPGPGSPSLKPMPAELLQERLARPRREGQQGQCLPARAATGLWHSWALIDTVLEKAGRRLPRGRSVEWRWPGPALIRFNVTSQDGAPLDFYVMSGRLRDPWPMDVRPRRGWLRGLNPVCSQCTELHWQYQLQEHERVMLIASNEDGRADAKLEFTEALFGVQSCLEESSVHPGGFLAACLVAAGLLGGGFALSRRLADERGGSDARPWDEAWVPQVMQCKRPPKPAEPWRAWILHACLLTYPWHPWRNDPLPFAFRCLVLVVSWGLTLFLSTLYGDLVGQWDYSAGALTSEDLDITDDSEGDSLSLGSVMLISSLSLVLEAVLRILALSIFRCSLAASQAQGRRFEIKASAMFVAAAVVATCIMYPLSLVLADRRCRYVRRLLLQFFVSDLVRGLPLAAAAEASGQYACKNWGASMLQPVPFCVEAIAVDTPSAASMLDQVTSDSSVTAEAKELLRALVEEFAGSANVTGEDLPFPCDIICCCCVACASSPNSCDGCCDCCDESEEEKRRRKRRSLLEAPGQDVMDEKRPSLLERIARLTSEDLGTVLRHAMTSEKWNAKEKFGLWLFEKKFGEHERQNLEACIERVKAVTPELMHEDNVTKEEVERKKNGHDAKALSRFAKLLVATSVAKHGAAIAEHGLGAIGLQQCEAVLCAGDLKYELDATGLHKCTWNCPDGQVPALFQSVGAEMAEQAEEITPLKEEAREVEEAAEEMQGMGSSPRAFEKSKALTQVNKLKLHFHHALSDKPLKLTKTASPSELGDPMQMKTSAIRYHGTCSAPNQFQDQLQRAVLFHGNNRNIPQGSVVEVTRVPTASTLGRFGNFMNPFSSNLKANEVEVTYHGQEYVVNSTDVQRTSVGKVLVDEGLQDWLISTGDTIQVQMPPMQQDPKEVLWFPVSKDKGD